VVETNIHHPTDSALLGDGVRVLIRTMKKITAITGVVGTKLRDRSRSVKLRLLDISRIARAKGQLNHERLKKGYRRLLNSTSRVVVQARRFSHEIATGVKRARGILKRLAPHGLRQELETMMPLVRQVMRQTPGTHLPRQHAVRGQALQRDRALHAHSASVRHPLLLRDLQHSVVYLPDRVRIHSQAPTSHRLGVPAPRHRRIRAPPNFVLDSSLERFTFLLKSIRRWRSSFCIRLAGWLG
jgi:hypothetical protein